MGYSILNHEKSSMLEMSYVLGAILAQELPDLGVLFDSTEVHEIPHDVLGELLVQLTEAVQTWIQEGRLDSTKSVYLTRRRRMSAMEYSVVEAARNLRDAVEEQFARGASLWIG